MNRRTIAIVANSCWNIHNFRRPVIDILLKNEWQVLVVAPRDAYSSYIDSYPMIRHVDLNHLSRDGINPLADVRMVMELVKIYREHKPDIVLHYTHKPNIYGGFAARKVGIPSIAVITGLGYPFLRRGVLQWVISRLYRWSSACHKTIVFENMEDREYFRRLHLSGATNTISVNGCGVDTRYFSPVAQPREEGPFTFLFLGRLLSDKGIYEYVAAAEILQKEGKAIRCVVVGEMDPGNPATITDAQLLQWVQENKIEYAGYHQDVRPAIASADCVVLPSYREAIPRVLTEAMAMGKPVITTDTAGCREAVTDGSNGWLVPPGDAVKLAQAMDRMASLSQDERNRMGMAGRQKTVTEYDDTLVAASILAIINQAFDSIRD